MANRLNTYILADNIVSSLGFTTRENLKALESGRSGIKFYDDCKVAGSFIPTAKIDSDRLLSMVKQNELSNYNKAEQLLILSIKELQNQHAVDFHSEDILLIISTTKGNVDLLTGTGMIPEASYLWHTGKEVAKYFGFDDRVRVISNACISGVAALIVAQRYINTGIYRHVVVAGVDILSHFVVAGFRSFRSLSRQICCPFDERRDGLSLGEACGSMLLSADKEEGAVVVRGGAITNDANHISGPSRDGSGLFSAMTHAMQSADISPEEVGFVNLHGTATHYNDEMESKAMRSAGLDRLPVNSLKPYFGHTLGASGIIESIVCVRQLRNKIIYGTPGYSNCGTSVPLNVSAFSRSLENVTSCLKTASGFGGCNAAIVFSTSDASVRQPVIRISIDKIKRVVIENSSIRSDEKPVFTSETSEFSVFIREAFKNLNENNPKFYKMDDLCKLSYIAAAYVLRDQKIIPEETGIVLSNSSSSLETDIKHIRIMERDGDQAASPSVFVYTLPNITAGEICIRHNIRFENLIFIEEHFDENRLEEYIRQTMQQREFNFCLYGWCELLGNNYKADIRLLKKNEIWNN